MRKILGSLLTITIVSGAAVGASSAFFSDTETSEGNIIQAGSVDLLIDSECHYFTDANADGQPEQVGCFHTVNNQQVQFGTWPEGNLTNEFFYWFEDVKPGDFGEHTISLHVVDNDAWGRFVIDGITNDENGLSEPEEELSDTVDTGELLGALEFFAWLDQGQTPGFQGKGQDPGEGDNVQNHDEPLIILPGQLNEGGEIHNIWEALSAVYASEQCQGDGSTISDCPGLTSDGHMVGSITYYFGLAWELPSETDNIVQTDSLTADLSFEVEQYRNNPIPFSQ